MYSRFFHPQDSTRLPYQDVEKIYNLRQQVPTITQEQIANILGMTKQSWQQIEITFKQWVADGRPEKSSYQRDYRLTYQQAKAFAALCSMYGLDEIFQFDSYDLEYRLLETAVLKDPTLTNDMLTCISTGQPDTLHALEQALFMCRQFNHGCLSGNPQFWLLRSALIHGIDDCLKQLACNDKELDLLIKGLDDPLDFIETVMSQLQPELERQLDDFFVFYNNRQKTAPPVDISVE